MLDWLRRLVGTKAPAPSVPVDRHKKLLADYRTLKARYDAAQTDENNRRHWGNADGLSAAGANNHGVRYRLRTRSRYEYDNSGYYSGIVRTRADDLVGTGPTLQVQSGDDDADAQIEEAFASWARASCFAESLHTMDQARNKDGEVLGLLTTNPKTRHPVKLWVKPVECDRLTAPVTKAGEDLNNDGIEYDEWGNPLTYTLLKQHPGDLQYYGSFALEEFDVVDAKYVLHWFRKDRPGQVRGVPELTPSLSVFPYLRRYTLATLSAAEIAASFAAMLETDAPPNDDDNADEPEPFEALEIERGMMTTLPAGSKMHQFTAEHPNSMFPEFKRETLQEGGRPLRMPVNVVTADSSKHNFSSAKLDHFGYRGALKVDRYFAELNLLERVYEAFVEEASLVPGVLPEGVDATTVKRRWYWPGWPSMDKDEAKSDTEQLNNGTTTQSELMAEWGRDWKEVQDQRAREIQRANALGLPPVPQSGGQPAFGASGVPEPPAPAKKAGANGRLNGRGVHHAPA